MTLFCVGPLARPLLLLPPPSFLVLSPLLSVPFALQISDRALRTFIGSLMSASAAFVPLRTGELSTVWDWGLDALDNLLTHAFLLRTSRTFPCAPVSCAKVPILIPPSLADVSLSRD
jgi:hypothetical protein